MLKPKWLSFSSHQPSSCGCVSNFGWNLWSLGNQFSSPMMGSLNWVIRVRFLNGQPLWRCSERGRLGSWWPQTPKNTGFQGPQKTIQKVLPFGTWPSSSLSQKIWRETRSIWCLHLLRKDSWLYSTADGFWCLSKKARWATSMGTGWWSRGK